jgi:glycosyltransferase involved in cell wall biosynthesis
MKTAIKVSWIFFAADAKRTFTHRALAERLAEIESVIIVDRPVSVLRDGKVPPLKARCNRLLGVEGCWHYRPLHYPERILGLGRITRLMNRFRLKQELNQLLPRDGKRIVCFDSPTQDHLIGKLGEDISIYLAIDDKTLTVWGEPIHGELEAEKRLLSKVDMVVCVSETLAEVLRSRLPSGRNIPIIVLPNGYDERVFDPGKNYLEPSDLARVLKPRVLVAGHISERIDWEGIRGAVKTRTDWTWVFIGPADAGMKEKINNMGGSTFYYPPIPAEEVPAWISHCDACAVPYRLNPFTAASSPLKAIEYLAMGAPVLSTRIPSLGCYDRAIEWVIESDGESYSKALSTLTIKSKDYSIRAFRQRAVSGDSWGARVNQFRKIIFNGIP